MSSKLIDGWQFWAFLSAIFAALTAIFAKLGVGGISSDVATLIRTLVVVALLLLIVGATGQFRNIEHIEGRTWLFLLCSGLATGASWLCYFRALKIGPASVTSIIAKLLSRFCKPPSQHLTRMERHELQRSNIQGLGDRIRDSF